MKKNLKEFAKTLKKNTLKRTKLKAGDILFLVNIRVFITINQLYIDKFKDAELHLVNSYVDFPSEILLNAKQKRIYKHLKEDKNGKTS